MLTELNVTFQIGPTHLTYLLHVITNCVFLKFANGQETSHVTQKFWGQNHIKL